MDDPLGPYALAELIALPDNAIPDHQAKVARWCTEFKTALCQTQVVWRDGRQLLLLNSDVRELLFTPDGRWLLGMGANTLRLWNTQQLSRPPRTRAFDIGGAWPLALAGRHLCVTGSNGETAIHTVLDWPSLRIISESRAPILRDGTTLVTGPAAKRTPGLAQFRPYVPPACT